MESFNGNGHFVLASRISGDIYVNRGIQGMAGQTVVPERFEVKITDHSKSVRAVVRGKDDRCQPLSLGYFSQHPPEGQLRELAVEI